MRRTSSWLAASLVALLALPAAAVAAPISADLDEARLQLGNGAEHREAASGMLSFEGQESAGNVTVPQGKISFPKFSLAGGEQVAMDAASPFVGTFVQSSGALALDGSVNITLALSPSGGCSFGGLELDLSTSAAAPSGDFEGTPFRFGLESAPGSVVAAWQDLPVASSYGSTAQDTCNALGSRIGGPGALQAGNDVSIVPFDVDWAASRLQLNNGIYDETEPADPAFASTELDGTYDLDDDSIVVDGTGVRLAQFRFDAGGLVVINPQSEGYTGSFDPATGALELGGPSSIEVYTNGANGCRFPVDLSFSTINDAPSGDFTGAPFAGGLDGPTGAAIATITSLDTVETLGSPAVGCEQLRQDYDGPGALSIGNVVNAVPTPALTLSASPGTASVRQGLSKTFRVRVGSEDARGGALNARVCADVPGGTRGLRLVGARCRSVGDVSGQAATVAFRVTATKRTAPKRYTLSFAASATGADPSSGTSLLQVQRKRRN